MSSIFVKHFELPCVERCYINKLALPCLAYRAPRSGETYNSETGLWAQKNLLEAYRNPTGSRPFFNFSHFSGPTFEQILLQFSSDQLHLGQ